MERNWMEAESRSNDKRKFERILFSTFFKARECSVILESNEGDSVIVVEYRGISEIYPLVYAIFEYPIT